MVNGPEAGMVRSSTFYAYTATIRTLLASKPLNPSLLLSGPTTSAEVKEKPGETGESSRETEHEQSME